MSRLCVSFYLVETTDRTNWKIIRNLSRSFGSLMLKLLISFKFKICSITRETFYPRTSQTQTLCFVTQNVNKNMVPHVNIYNDTIKSWKAYVYHL